MNPRKLAKAGFINPAENTIQCCSCGVRAKFKPDFNFTATEENGRDRLEKMKKAHFNDCIFRMQAGDQGLKIRFPDAEFGVNSL